MGLKEVVRLFLNETQELVHVFTGDEEVQTTTTHPFWVEDKGWVSAGELESGDVLLSLDGTYSVVEGIAVECLDEPIAVYNFEVADWHTYFVSESRVLVHNMCAAANTIDANAAGRLPGRTIDPLTGEEVGRFVVDPNGNIMIEPVGGATISAGRGGVDTHTLYPNGSNYQRLNPFGHANNPTPHAHGHLQGTGPGMRGQGPSINIHGKPVPWNSLDAHWRIK